MKKVIALALIGALCVGLLLYNLFGFDHRTATEQTTAGAQTNEEKSGSDQEPEGSDVQVRVLNTDPDRQAAWEQIGADYTASTGVEVVILDGTDDRQPTVFLTDGTGDVDPESCQDLSGTVACAQLADMGLTLRAGEKVYGIAAEVGCFGLIYNENLLAEVATPEEIVDITTFSTVVQNIVQKGHTAFAGRGLNDGVAVRLASMPGNIRSLADLWVGYASRDAEDSALDRFLAGESVFYLGSTDEYETITAAGIQRLGILPLYQDLDEQTYKQQSLCVVAERYWCVRSDVPEETAAALAFLDHLLTSSEDGQVPVDRLELLAPYRQATYCANPLEKVLRADVAAGKGLLVCQAITEPPAGYVDALTAYAQDPTDENWEKVEQLSAK